MISSKPRNLTARVVSTRLQILCSEYRGLPSFQVESSIIAACIGEPKNTCVCLSVMYLCTNANEHMCLFICYAFVHKCRSSLTASDDKDQSIDRSSSIREFFYSLNFNTNRKLNRRIRNRIFWNILSIHNLFAAARTEVKINGQLSDSGVDGVKNVIWKRALVTDKCVVWKWSGLVLNGTAMYVKRNDLFLFVKINSCHAFMKPW